MAEINATQMRDALAWATNDRKTAEDPATNPWEWFWQAIQGDFNENRTTGQIVIDAAISMIPLVDQVCDVRDLIANCKKLKSDVTNTWAWVALVLTLIGLFPFLGSAVKGVLKVFFAFVRRSGGNAILRAVDSAMTWVITLLRREAFQRYLRFHKVDEVFSWLAKEIKVVQKKVNVNELLLAFDKGIAALRRMVSKVQYIPGVGAKAKHALEQVVWVRSKANERFSEISRTIDSVFDSIVLRLERESISNQHGILNANNIHYRGALPEAAAVRLMRRPHPLQSWMNEGNDLRWPGADYDLLEPIIASRVKQGWPPCLSKT